jgi:hypothetical protein
MWWERQDQATRNRNIVLAWVGGLAVFLLIAMVVSGGGSRSSHYGSPDAVIAAINDKAGIKCSQGASALWDPNIGTCYVFAPSGDVITTLAVSTSDAGYSALYDKEVAREQSMGSNLSFPIWMAHGDDWLVSCGTSQDLARQVADGLGGRVDEVKAP